MIYQTPAFLLLLFFTLVSCSDKEQEALLCEANEYQQSTSENPDEYQCVPVTVCDENQYEILQTPEPA